MESNKKFSVDSGHARGENISIEEIHQALRDIMNWLLTNIPSYSPPPGLASVPSSLDSVLSSMLSLHNGGIQLEETFKTLSLQEIENSINSFKASEN